jgi:hypothetical protein
MNNKRSVYILLPLVALVWGLIGWRIWAAASEPEEATTLASATVPKVRPAAARLPRLRRPVLAGGRWPAAGQRWPGAGRGVCRPGHSAGFSCAAAGGCASASSHRQLAGYQVLMHYYPCQRAGAGSFAQHQQRGVHRESGAQRPRHPGATALPRFGAGEL